MTPTTALTDTPAPAKPTEQCLRCDGLLGPLENPWDLYHPICGWASPADWKALLPWLTGGGSAAGSD